MIYSYFVGFLLVSDWVIYAIYPFGSNRPYLNLCCTTFAFVIKYYDNGDSMSNSGHQIPEFICGGMC